MRVRDSPASQVTQNVRTGDMYAWTGHGNGSTDYTQNGLNQQVTVGGAAASWDSKGNLTAEPQSGKTYGYSSENLLTSASGGVSLGYDPAMRLYQTAGAATTRFLYDGLDAIAEYNGSNALQRRYVFDPTTGQPVLWYEGSGTAATDRRYLSVDERASVISVSDSAGASLGLNSYDEYGKPGASNIGRYQYTGQKWIGEAGLYDYKTRDYVPQLGIFAQTDPIGYDDSPNLYAYVLNDPVNLVDPLGLASEQAEIFITAYPLIFSAYGSYLISGLFAGAVMRGEFDPPDPNEIVVRGTRIKPSAPPKNPLAFSLISAEVIDAATKAMRDLLQHPKPKSAQRPPSKPTRSQIEQFCTSVMSIAIPVGGAGYGAWEGFEMAGPAARIIAFFGAEGAAAGPLGAIAGAAAGGISAWALITYGPDYIPVLCER